MDYVKAIAVAGSAAYGVEKMLKVFRLWKQANRGEKAAMGLTVKNGEYVSLLQTLGRIERRIDHLAIRMDSVEQRLST